MRNRPTLHPFSPAAVAARSRFAGWVMEDQGGDSGDQGGNDSPDQDNQDQGGDDGGQDDGSDDPRVKRANSQAARYRTERNELRAELDTLRQQAEQSNGVLDALRKALDPNAEGGDETTPEQLAQQAGARVTELEAENADLRAQLVVHDVATDAGGNPSALLDSRSFTNALGALDASADDYRDQVSQLIKDAVARNTNLRAAGQAPRRGGAENAGGAGGNATVTAEQFKDMDYTARVELKRSNPTLYRQLADAT